MKRALKIISVIMSIVMILSIVPVFSMFSATAEDGKSWDYFILQDHNTEKAVSVDDTSKIGWGTYADLPNREWVSDYTLEETKWVLKLTTPKNAELKTYIL